MIQVPYMYFYYYYISSTSDHQALDPGDGDPHFRLCGYSGLNSLNTLGQFHGEESIKSIKSHSNS